MRDMQESPGFFRANKIIYLALRFNDRFYSIQIGKYLDVMKNEVSLNLFDIFYVLHKTTVYQKKQKI